MKFRIVCVGKLKNAPLRALAEDYAARLRHFVPVEIVELKDGKAADGASRLKEEAKSIREALEGKSGAGLKSSVLWDEKGGEMDTAQFAKFLESKGGRNLDFVIGSSHGLDAGLKRDIPKHLRLSAFTFTHEWARALALEQIYRAFCLLRGHPYHH